MLLSFCMETRQPRHSVAWSSVGKTQGQSQLVRAKRVTRVASISLNFMCYPMLRFYSTEIFMSLET